MLPELPSGYVPYKQLIICTNRLVDVKVPFLVKGKPVLLVGLANAPLIWLSAPTEPSRRIWQFIVNGGKAAHPAAEIQTDEQNRSVQIKVASHRILLAKALSDDEAIVEFLDLRPIGLAIEGNLQGMRIGGMTLTNNSFVNVAIAFALGETPADGVGPSQHPDSVMKGP